MMALTIMEDYILEVLDNSRKYAISNTDMVMEYDELIKCCTLIHKIFGKDLIIKVYWDVICEVIVIEYEGEKGRFYEENKNSNNITVSDICRYMNLVDLGEDEILSRIVYGMENICVLLNVDLKIVFEEDYKLKKNGESNVEYSVGY